MKFRLLLAAIGSTLVLSCTNDDSTECIEDRIANFGTEVCENGATVIRYTFQGQTTYAINFGSCVADYHDLVLNENCDTLGLIGGFGGFAEINGEDFYANASLEETIWQN